MNNNILKKTVPLSNVILIIIILFLLIGGIFLAYKSGPFQAGSSESETVFVKNSKVLNFTKLFVEKVLKSESEIDFETRLELENAVREIKDGEILAQWQKFVDSKTEEEAQQEVKNLLELLVNKIQ